MMKYQGKVKKDISLFEKYLYSFLKNAYYKFDLTTLKGETYKNVKLLDYDIDKAVIMTTGEKRFKLSEIFKISIFTKNLKDIETKFFKNLPESTSFQYKKGSIIYIYPYNKPPLRYKLINYYPYNLLLLKKLKRGYLIDVVYKLGLSAFSFEKPYPKEFIKESEPTSEHTPRTWLSTKVYIDRNLKEEFRQRRKDELLVTLALKDGREITGYYYKLMRKLEGERYTLYCPKNKKISIKVFAHAIEDFWIEE